MRDRLQIIAARHGKSMGFVLLGLALIGFTGRSAQSQSGDRFDVVIANGRVVDGTGAPWFRGGHRHHRRPHHRNRQPRCPRGRHEIDATGLVVAPGFIDLLGQSEFNVLVDNRAASKITRASPPRSRAKDRPLRRSTIADGRCGTAALEHFGVAPDWRTLDEYFDRLRAARTGDQRRTFVGAGGCATTSSARTTAPPRRQELEQMKALVAEAMAQGALGSAPRCSTCRIGSPRPTSSSSWRRSRRAYGGVYFTHQRSESDRIFESLDEVLAIAERAGIPGRDLAPEDGLQGQLGQDARGAAPHRGGARPRPRRDRRTCIPTPRLQRPRCVPAVWAREGGTDDMLARLTDPATRERVKQRHGRSERATWENQWYGSGGGDGVMVSSVLDPALRKYEGMSLDADRQGDGQGSARCGHRSGHRRSGGVVGHHLDHGREPT